MNEVEVELLALGLARRELWPGVWLPAPVSQGGAFVGGELRTMEVDDSGLIDWGALDAFIPEGAERIKASVFGMLDGHPVIVHVYRLMGACALQFVVGGPSLQRVESVDMLNYVIAYYSTTLSTLLSIERGVRLDHDVLQPFLDSVSREGHLGFGPFPVTDRWRLDGDTEPLPAGTSQLELGGGYVTAYDEDGCGELAFEPLPTASSVNVALRQRLSAEVDVSGVSWATCRAAFAIGDVVEYRFGSRPVRGFAWCDVLGYAWHLRYLGAPAWIQDALDDVFLRCHDSGG